MIERRCYINELLINKFVRNWCVHCTHCVLVDSFICISTFILETKDVLPVYGVPSTAVCMCVCVWCLHLIQIKAFNLERDVTRNGFSKRKTFLLISY